MSLLPPPPPLHPIALDAPRAEPHRQQAPQKRDDIRTPIAPDPTMAFLQHLPLTTPFLDRADTVRVIYLSINQVEEISKWDGGQGHDAPVLTHAALTEGFDDQGRTDSVQDAVAKTGEAGEKGEESRRGDERAGSLCDEEHERGE